jgi:predicted RNA binding protein YcfA (HicA-like mRNA interferase family)
MRIPRDISSTQLIKLLKKWGYEKTRQKGSHIRLTTFLEGEHHITIPDHNPIRLGTLSSILIEIAGHFKKTKDEIANEIF